MRSSRQELAPDGNAVCHIFLTIRPSGGQREVEVFLAERSLVPRAAQEEIRDRTRRQGRFPIVERASFAPASW